MMTKKSIKTKNNSKNKIDIGNIAGGFEGIAESTRNSLTDPLMGDVNSSEQENDTTVSIPINEGLGYPQDDLSDLNTNSQLDLNTGIDLADLANTNFGKVEGNFVSFNEQGQPQISEKKPNGNLKAVFEGMHQYVDNNNLTLKQHLDLLKAADNLFEKRVVGGWKSLFFSRSMSVRDETYNKLQDRICEKTGAPKYIHEQLRYINANEEKIAQLKKISAASGESIHIHKEASVQEKGVVNQENLMPPMSMEVLPDGKLLIISHQEIGRGAQKKAKIAYLLDGEGSISKKALLRVNPDTVGHDSKRNRAIREIGQDGENSGANSKIMQHMRENDRENLLGSIEGETMYKGKYTGEKGVKPFIVKDLIEPEMKAGKGQKSAELSYLFTYRNRALYNRVFPDIKSKLEFMKETSDAFAAIHDAGYIHRDVKSENIFVKFIKNEQGEIIKAQPVIGDFGFADEKGQSTGLKGTYYTMAPEVVDAYDEYNKQITDKSDIFSLGVIFHEIFDADMFIGLDKRTIGEGENEETIDIPKSVYGHNLKEKASSLKNYIDDYEIPVNHLSNVANLMIAMLHNDPEQRPSAEEISKILDRAIKSIS